MRGEAAYMVEGGVNDCGNGRGYTVAAIAIAIIVAALIYFWVTEGDIHV